MLESILKYWLKTSAQIYCTRLLRGAFIKVEKKPSFLKPNFLVTLKKISLELEKTEKCLAINFVHIQAPRQLVHLRPRNIHFCLGQNFFSFIVVFIYILEQITQQKENVYLVLGKNNSFPNPSIVPIFRICNYR